MSELGQRWQNERERLGQSQPQGQGRVTLIYDQPSLLNNNDKIIRTNNVDDRGKERENIVRN